MRQRVPSLLIHRGSIFLSTLELDELQSSEFTLREQIRFFFLELSHCTRCEKPIDAGSRRAGHPLCRKHYRQLKRQNAPQDTEAPIGKKGGQDEWAVHDTGLASFLRARRKRLSHASASLPRSRSKATLCRANTMVHTPSAL